MGAGVAALAGHSSAGVGVVTKGKAKAALNAAIGNSISANVLKRLWPRVLYAAGLLLKLKGDWELAPLATDGQTGGAECEVF